MNHTSNSCSLDFGSCNPLDTSLKYWLWLNWMYSNKIVCVRYEKSYCNLNSMRQWVRENNLPLQHMTNGEGPDHLWKNFVLERKCCNSSTWHWVFPQRVSLHLFVQIVLRLLEINPTYQRHLNNSEVFGRRKIIINSVYTKKCAL